MNILDAAYDLLHANGHPMSAKDMAKCLLENGTWSPKGKTPDATLGARIYMDIKRNGNASRFIKAGKGMFALSGIPSISKKANVVNQQKAKEILPASETFSFTDCAQKVLQSQGNHTPMHYQSITKIALENGWLATSGKTPEATMYAQIIQEIQRLRKRGEVPRFVQCGKGKVALSAWDKAGVDFQIQQHHDDVRKKLKQKIMDLSAEQFEELVLVLFRKMGFTAVSRTRLSGDGGIDVRGTMVTSGVIQTVLAIQVKRWKANVQAPIVQQVRGSLGAHEQGCIVTTSNFSAGARNEAREKDKAPIALIDGEELLKLMLEYQVGVRRKEVPLFEIRENLLDCNDEDDL